MGAWGHGIWDNDTACDIELDFKDFLKEVDTKREALQLLIKKWGGYDWEDAILTLADIQIEYNTLVDEKIIAKAKLISTTKQNLFDWSIPEEREKVLDDFHMKSTMFLLKNKG